jgi:hypothetical protein
MTKIVYRIDERVNLVVILFLFWALFWGLNGGDKFFNGQWVRYMGRETHKAELVDSRGGVSYKFYTMHPTGWYGVNRDVQLIDYFKRLYLPKELALISLYSIGAFELLLCLIFSSLFVWSVLPEQMRESKAGLFADRTIHRLAFKGSILIFMIFSVGDILFGDRTELWEHGTFIILCLYTYDVWYRSDQFFIKMRRGKIASDSQEADTRSIQATEYQQT